MLCIPRCSRGTKESHLAIFQGWVLLVPTWPPMAPLNLIFSIFLADWKTFGVELGQKFSKIIKKSRPGAQGFDFRFCSIPFGVPCMFTH